jgi:hypothetical protein
MVVGSGNLNLWLWMWLRRGKGISWLLSGYLLISVTKMLIVSIVASPSLHKLLLVVVEKTFVEAAGASWVASTLPEVEM